MTVAMEGEPTAGDVVVDVGANKSVSFSGVDVSFTDLSYEVPIKKKEPLKILSGISSSFNKNCMTALMGPSGCGKTTLMDIVANRKTGLGKIQGEILFGGVQVPAAALKHLCGYVEQFDTLLGELSVAQMLMYTAELKLPTSVNRQAKQTIVDKVIEALRLSKCKDTVIGNALKRGISGGQAKRVNIALALVTQPLVLFLDEPTSGLDSKMANEVCVILQSLATQGCTVVASIHTPTSYAFSLFNDLLMLHSGGHVIYDGAIGDAKPYFSSLGYAFPEGGYSVPDWLVEITCVSDEDAQDTSKTKDFAELWQNSEASKKRAASLSDQVATAKASPASNVAAMKAKPVGGPGQIHALRTLLAFRMTTHYKDGEFLGPRFGDKIFMGLIAMSLYWGIGDKTDVQSMQSTAACLYFFIALCGYGAAAFVPSLTLERALFFRERADGCYSPVTYYLSKFIEESIICVITSVVFSLMVFYPCKFQGSFLIFLTSYFLTTMIGIVLAYVVAAIAPNMEAANALLPAYVTVCMFFGGLFIVFDEIPVGWKWFSYTSFLRYSFGSLMLNQFDNDMFRDLSVFFQPGQTSGEGQTILSFYGMAEGDGIMNNMGVQFAINTGLCFFFAALGAAALGGISHVKR
jgi:ABC-type multidrug transport system ATPase subunit